MVTTDAMRPPFPFKLAVFKAETRDPSCSAWSVETFDCDVNPLPLPFGSQFYSGHVGLRHLPPEAHHRINRLLTNLNEDEMIQMLGYSWILRSINVDWSRRRLDSVDFVAVIELMDPRLVFEQTYGRDSQYSDYSEARSEGSTDQDNTSTPFDTPNGPSSSRRTPRGSYQLDDLGESSD
ncbi:hypothetical protein TWF481_000127 [Arthrobotrys musiformis]|uniref:HNH nuclease domain-containing protein n=1 Tax=Arthrobotrys musiformis TaxID=47236 RepID=A0AAV9WLT7_9PEZI